MFFQSDFFFPGAGIFVTTVVAGSIALIKPFTVASRPFLRDVIFYMAAVFWTFNILYKGHISMGEAVGLITVIHLPKIYTFILNVSRSCSRIKGYQFKD